ncbi:MAG: hypothetical protein FRX48_07110 [Lasallia pustulata]|uniref:Uncharacterized protein n=1 Tax=Lasallia pustulata TaxID=136370 RepID=A0A5M8PH85_9LECA|nr:MAG: hypothetical protein FRX48_07110 [Lasallia pustulata]
MCLPCCIPFADVYLEDPPKKKEEEKKEEEQKEYIFVNDDAVFCPPRLHPVHTSRSASFSTFILTTPSTIKMSYYTYVPAKAAAPASKHYYDYSKPAAPAPAPAPEPAKPIPSPLQHGYIQYPQVTTVTHASIAARIGATKPVQLVPYDPSPEQQFWCRELDTSYTLRTAKDITENLQPGFWQYAQGGYPYWVCMEKK